MSIFSSILFPYHVEIQMLAPSEQVFHSHKVDEKIFTFDAETTHTIKYVDTYWDTESADLYSSGRMLRSRSKNIDSPSKFVEYKGDPHYIDGLLIGRVFGGISIQNGDPAPIINGRVGSEPMKRLFNDRPDLIGSKFISRAYSETEKVARSLSLKGKLLSVRLTFHEFTIVCEDFKSSLLRVVEVEISPNSSKPLFSLQNEIP